MKVVNKKASFNYELGERLEAGIELTGAEAKSAKLGQVEMGSAYVKIQSSKFKSQKEAWIYNLQIYPYKYADNTNYDPMRKRKLLLHQREIVGWMSKMKQSGRMTVATALYTKGGRVKVEIALVRGKRKYEKREKIKKRDEERRMR